MRISRTTGRVAGTVAAAAFAVVGLGPVAADAASGPYCGITWGSTAKRAVTPDVVGDVTAVRPGRHACFDRVVLDGSWSARVRYVDAVRADGSGDVVPVRGGARLEVVATTGEGGAGWVPADRREVVDVRGYRTLRQVASASDFEGQLTLAVGVRARLPFRVFVLEAPGAAPRVVIDVAHRW